MLGRDKLTVVMWVTAGIAAVAVIVLDGKLEHAATVIGATALVAGSSRTRCLDRRRARRQRRSDAVVMSSAGHIRALARSITERQAEDSATVQGRLDGQDSRLDRQDRQIRAVYSYLGRGGDPRGPADDREQTGPIPRLGLVKDEAS